MKTTLPPSKENYTTHSSEVPKIPNVIAPYIEARKQVAELDHQLRAIKQADNTRQAFAEFY